MTNITPVQIALHSVDGVIYSVEYDAPDYDPDLCNDGGSYRRESLDVSFSTGGHHCQLLVDDSSCGDFGGRYYAALYVAGNVHATANFGSMLRTDELWSSFSRTRQPDRDALKIACELGLYIPDEDDISGADDDDT